MTPVGNLKFPVNVSPNVIANLPPKETFLGISPHNFHFPLFSIDNTIVIKWKRTLSSQSCSHYPYYLKTFFSLPPKLLPCIKMNAMKKQKGFPIVFSLWIKFCSNLKLFLDDLTLLLFSHFLWKHIIHSRSNSFCLSFFAIIRKEKFIWANTENVELNVYQKIATRNYGAQ